MTGLAEVAKRVLPDTAFHWLRTKAQQGRRLRPFGRDDFGRLERLEPVSRRFGLDRGMPIDRYYIERFLHKHAADIRGRVLEIGDDAYTRAFGDGRVLSSDILHPIVGDPIATIVGDLTDPTTLPDSAFDCVICTQTLHLIFEVTTAVSTLRRILRPGGVVLATMAGISQISRFDMDRWGDCWRFTTRSAENLFEQMFDAEDLDIVAYGNVYAAVCFLHGLAVEEVQRENLDHTDPDYELLIGVRAGCRAE